MCDALKENPAPNNPGLFAGQEDIEKSSACQFFAVQESTNLQPCGF